MTRGELFTTIRSEGGLLPPDLLARIAQGDSQQGLQGLKADDFGLAQGERLTEAIARAWEHARAYWTAWQASREGPGGAGISETREQWLLPLFRELGYGRLAYRQAAEEVDGRRFVISHRVGEEADAPPVHTVAPNHGLDHAARADGAGPRRSPHGLMQEYLNRTGHLWGVVSDGHTLRLLRDNASLSRAAYVEVNLDAMFREGVYSDFVLLYLLLHRSRLPRPGAPIEEAWLEIWRRESEASGARALDALRGGVETAIKALGQGLMEHPANEELRRRLHADELTVQDYYRQLLRLVYRLLFLLAAEERDLLFAPDADPRGKAIYSAHYGIGRLRELARRRSNDRHDDLWQGVQTLFRVLREPESAEKLGLAALGGLFDANNMRDVDGREGEGAARLSNGWLLEALRGLGWVETGGARRRINYRDMDVEELGSVYEGLLEQQPAMRSTGERTVFALDVSGERKTTGSYYTNPGLVRELIRSALEPAIEAALAKGGTKEEKRHHLLDLKLCDPACGSGHFLLAAARRIGRAVAEVAAGDDEPSPTEERAAIREAIGHCIYGVDLNPLAVDLCKVALWLEGQNAGKPLQFLDHHIRHGNSLIGATTEAMKEGIPDAAFDPVTGDSKQYAATIKKRNRAERKGQLSFEGWDVAVTHVTLDADRKRYFASMDRADDSLADVAAKEWEHYQHRRDPEVVHRKLTADLWTAAFFWPLDVGEANPPTDGVWRRLAADPQLVDYLDERKTAEVRDRTEFRTVREAWRLSREHRFFHWELEFEDVFSRVDPGFDVILGNPPWDVIQPEEKKWFAGRDDQIAEAAGARRKALIEALAKTNPTLHEHWSRHVRDIQSTSKLVRKSGRFPLTGQGDLNTYSLFSEVAAQTVRARGRAGIIVPTGIATDDSNKAFFSSLVNNRRLVSLFDFENSQGLFPNVHRSYKFSLLTTGRPQRPDGAFDAAFFVTQPSQLADSERIFTLSPEEIALLNPNTRTAPIFRSARDAEITKQLYRAAPVLVREGAEEINPWGVTLRQGLFNMTSDSHLFRTREELEASGHELSEDGRFCGADGTWERLYEAKMIHQFDHRFATYEQAGRNEERARDTTRDEHKNPDHVVLPRYWVNTRMVETEALEKCGAPREWFLGYRDIARATDERTVIAALFPRTGAVIHICQSTESAIKSAGLLADMNSVVFDFAARQKAGGTHLNFFIVKQLPVLPPETYTPALLDQIVPRVLELVYTAWDLAPFARDLGYEGDPFPWEEEQRALLRAELDGIYAHLYGLNRDDFAYILEQFPIVKRKDVAAFGEYRTARLCLEAYDYFSKTAQMKLWEAVREIETRLSQRVVQRLHNDINSVPEKTQAGQEAERLKQGKPPQAGTLADFLEAGYLPLLGKVIRANRERFADMFETNGQVEAHLSPLIGLRNTLAHTKEAQIADKVRRSGETEVRWFAERLGIEIELVAPPAI